MSDDCAFATKNSSVRDLLHWFSATIHISHHGCIQHDFKSKQQCPICLARAGEPRANHPLVQWLYQAIQLCSGFENTGSLVIKYDIPSECQQEYHKNPGASFNGNYVKAYLPNCAEGGNLLKRPNYAFLHLSLLSLSVHQQQPRGVTRTNLHLFTTRHQPMGV